RSSVRPPFCQAQARGGSPGPSRDEEKVSRLRTRSSERLAFGASPEEDRHDRLLRVREIASHEVDAERCGARECPPGHCEREFLSPLGAEGDGQQEELRPSAHRGDVREIDRERSAADRLWILVRKKIDALDEKVG